MLLLDKPSTAAKFKTDLERAGESNSSENLEAIEDLMTGSNDDETLSLSVNFGELSNKPLGRSSLQLLHSYRN